MWPAQVCRDVMGWDVLNWSQALDFWDRHLPRRLEHWRALELGAAGGGLSLYLALKGAEVICSNLELPGPVTRECHQRYGLSQIEYAAVDARQLPYADESLDLVCFKSVLGGIRKQHPEDPKPAMIAEIWRVLKPGGQLIFAENARGHWLHQFLRRSLVSWSAGWEYLEIQDIERLMRSFARFEHTSCGALALLGRNEMQRRALGQVDRYVVPHMPEAWRYLMIAWAQKAPRKDKK